MSLKEYFPGANTPKGFYSYYSHILKPDEAKKVVILKGGPGTGKSSLMKKVSKYASDSGFCVELLHCSSDPDSLDGVCIRERGFLILDGTSPHIVDPRIPGAVDEIINLGECWDAEKIKQSKNQIEKISSQISTEFSRAYAYMNAAHSLFNKMKSDVSYENEWIFEEFNRVKDILDFGKIKSAGTQRKAFLSAHTHKGRVSYADSFLNDAKYVIHVIPGRSGSSEIFMKECAHTLTLCGGDVRIFYSFMDPDTSPEFIFEEKRGIFITSQDFIKKDIPHMTVDFNSYENRECVDSLIKEDLQIYNTLMEKTTKALKNAKKLHDELESFYIPHMDFEKVDLLAEKIFE